MKKFIFFFSLFLFSGCRQDSAQNETITPLVVEAIIEQPETETPLPPSKTAAPLPTRALTDTPPATETMPAPTIISTPTLRPTAIATYRPTPTPRPQKENAITPVAIEHIIPLNDLGNQTYQGFTGGLYPNGSNVMPASHAAAGLQRANQIQPLDRAGNPNPNGKIVMLAIGMSNTTQEVCGSRQVKNGCLPWTFIGKAEQDPTVNHNHLVIVDGARGGQVAHKWDGAEEENFSRVNDSILPDLALSPPQVQIVWVKVANPGPRFSLPSNRADAYTLMTHMGGIVRALQSHYPNLQQVYLSSRIFAGFATTTLNPEPYAYEYGFSVKWLIESQINQMSSTEINPKAGDLNYANGTAPWLAWGPYLWANSNAPRSDGLLWTPEDFDDRDFTHPDTSGEEKVANMLMGFFKTSPTTRCWFLADGLCQ